MVHWRSRESDNILKGYKLDIQVIYYHHHHHRHHHHPCHCDCHHCHRHRYHDTFSDDDWVKGPPFNPELGVQIHALQKGIFYAHIYLHS